MQRLDGDGTVFDAVIVGAGHNGLVCAAYLARGGLRPLVLERRSLPGGACVTEEIPGAPGYRVSTGAAQCANFRPEIVCDLDLARFDHGRSRRGKKLHLHAPVRPKSLRKPCLGHESATSILTGAGEES